MSTKRFRCCKCGTSNDKWTRYCQRCGGYGVIVRTEVYDGVTILGPVVHDDGLERLGEIDAAEVPRLITKIKQLDEALGGGLAYPCVVQFGGQPGIGKSTLLLQVANALSNEILYVSSEELGRFIAARAKRLKLGNLNKIRFLSSESPSKVKEMIIKSGVRALILDSLQGMRLDPVIGEDGKPKQAKHTQSTVRDIALDLINFALKKEDYEEREGDPITIITVNHVNKEGDMAGLKEIEHMVDVVAWFTGPRSGNQRMFRLEKNRFGPTDKAAHFTMEKDGLREREEGDDEPEDEQDEKPKKSSEREQVALALALSKKRKRTKR